MDQKQNFQDLLSAVTEVGTLHEDVIFIGGIAVYFHAINKDSTREYAEATTDADFYISLSSLSDLRTVEELSQNSRLSKQEFQKNGFSFAVYAERHSALTVPFDQVIANAVEYDGIKVAGLEELLVLKLAAAANRYTSAHGKKDAKDIIRILMLAGSGPGFDPQRATLYMTKEHLEFLEKIVKGPEFTSMAMGNAQTAKRIRFACGSPFSMIKDAFENPSDKSDHSYQAPPPPTPALVQMLLGDKAGKKKGKQPKPAGK